jgi:cytochrome c
MKKAIFLAAIIGLLAACGGGDKDKTGGETKKEEKPVDNSSNPDYQKGLTAIEKTPICFTCHKVDEKNIGPAWREVANKYASLPKDSAVNYLVHKISAGGTGVWGEAMMPPNSAVPKEDLEAIAKYILLLKNN